jgi:DnaJ-domain-containing protein 1
MKLDSKYFDSIRVASSEDRVVRDTGPLCQWKGCTQTGQHRAPKGRGQDGQYYVFCMDHVRQYNASYNYFDGMSNSEVEDFRKDALTGHRPTWKLGENAWAAGKEALNAARRYARFAQGPAFDPHGALDEEPEQSSPKAPTRRPLRTLERKALESMHLPETASAAEIKARFKDLVKRHHPDANGGDRGAEEKLREIIQAYNYLKQAGLV